jgi:hypothetical protein
VGCNSLVYVVHRVEFAETDGLFRLISLKHEFPTAIHQLLNPSGEMQSTEFELDRKHFPLFRYGQRPHTHFGKNLSQT